MSIPETVKVKCGDDYKVIYKSDMKKGDVLYEKPKKEKLKKAKKEDK